MRKLFVALVLIMGVSAMTISEVEARRFGGGSFGRQSQNVGRMPPAQRSQPAQQNQTAQNRQAQQGAAGAAPRRFGGMMTSVLLGLGLGALLAHLGIGAELAGLLATILMVGLLVLAAKMIFRMMARRHQPVFQPAAASQGTQREGLFNPQGGAPQIGSGLSQGSTPQIGSGLSASQASGGIGLQDVGEDGKSFTWSIPDDFELEAFIRSAKAYYIRLQAAWDKSDIEDIHEFTTPQMFAEMKLQLKERGDEPNITDVISIDAELLGIEVIGSEYFASVKFTGTVRENRQAELTSFTEVWNMTRPVSEEEGWVLAGVQQVS